MNSDNENIELGYKCSECGKYFSEKYNMQVHMRIHNGERPYKCDICGRRFASLGNKNDHSRRHA